MRAVLVVVTLVAAGCGKDPPPTAREEKPPAGSAGKPVAPRVEVKTPPEWAPAPDRPAARALSAPDVTEMTRAFSDNPVTAMKRYGPVRWQFEATVLDIKGPALVAISPLVDGLGPALLDLRSEQEVEKVRNGGRYKVEARVRGYTPPPSPAQGFDFADGVVAVEVARPAPVPAPETRSPQRPADDGPPAPFTTWVKLEHLGSGGAVVFAQERTAAAQAKSGKWSISGDGVKGRVEKGDRLTLKDGTVLVIEKATLGTSGRYVLEVRRAP